MSFGDSTETPYLLPELSYDQLKQKEGNALMSQMSSPRLKIRARVSPAECVSPETNSFHAIPHSLYCLRALLNLRSVRRINLGFPQPYYFLWERERSKSGNHFKHQVEFALFKGATPCLCHLLCDKLLHTSLSLPPLFLHGDYTLRFLEQGFLFLCVCRGEASSLVS